MPEPAEAPTPERELVTCACLLLTRASVYRILTHTLNPSSSHNLCSPDSRLKMCVTPAPTRKCCPGELVRVCVLVAWKWPHINHSLTPTVRPTHRYVRTCTCVRTYVCMYQHTLTPRGLNPLLPGHDSQLSGLPREEKRRQEEWTYHKTHQ